VRVERAAIAVTLAPETPDVLPGMFDNERSSSEAAARREREAMKTVIAERSSKT
jgi:hypothetical protein